MQRLSTIWAVLCCGLLGQGGTAFGAPVVYDFSAGAGVDRFAFGISVPDIPIPPTSNAVPSTPFSAADYTAVAASDDARYDTGIIEGGIVAATRFVFTIAEPASSITQMDVLWEGGAGGGEVHSVWLWNAVTGSYVLVGSQNAVVPPDGLITGTFTASPSDFVDGANAVTVLVTYNVQGGSLLTDYVSVTVTRSAACNVNADCDDALYCNGVETCVSGVCQPGTPITCDDGYPCTVDSCNEATDSCDNLDIDFTIVAVPTLGGPSNSATGINDLGQAVGSSSLDFQPGGDSHAYIWNSSGGTPTDLGTFGGSNSVGNDINNVGEVTGYAYNATGIHHVFRWQNGIMTDLMAAYPTTFGAGWRINESGLVVGHLGSGAFVWQNGVLTNPGSMGSPTRAFGVNGAGQVVGESSIRAFFWQDDGDPSTTDIRDLGTLPGGLPRARARGINDAVQVVGDANYGSSDLEDYHAALWENLAWDAAGNYTGDITDLGVLPGGQRSFAYAVNNAGQVVGHSMTAGAGAPHAYLYDLVHGMRDLNDLIPPDSGWFLRFAMDINESGQIVGYGYLNGQQRGFLLTPILKPITGDLDDDCDTDVDDFLMFSNCFNGTANPLNPLCANPAADLDGDGDVDPDDFLTFSNCFNGALNPPACF